MGNSADAASVTTAAKASADKISSRVLLLIAYPETGPRDVRNGPVVLQRPAGVNRLPPGWAPRGQGG